MNTQHLAYPEYQLTGLLYENALRTEAAVSDWVREGVPTLSFGEAGMRLSNGMDASAGQAANYLFWAPPVIEGNFRATWRFRPIEEPGLAMFWFCAAGRGGEDLFDPRLAPRAGQYRQYHTGDINGYHLSYFRRKNADERGFHTCNLRKSHGFHLVCQGADPIPSVEDVQGPFQIELVKLGQRIGFAINGLPVLVWEDTGAVGGPPLQAGRIGFRQMAPLVADYADLRIEAIA